MVTRAELLALRALKAAHVRPARGPQGRPGLDGVTRIIHQQVPAPLITLPPPTVVHGNPGVSVVDVSVEQQGTTAVFVFSLSDGRVMRHAVKLPTPRNGKDGAIFVRGGIANSAIPTILQQVSVTADYTVEEDVGTVLASGTLSVILPAASGRKGPMKRLAVKNTGSGTVTISGGTIDGQSSLVLANQYDAAMLESDASVWYVV